MVIINPYKLALFKAVVLANIRRTAANSLELIPLAGTIFIVMGLLVAAARFWWWVFW
jgi:hypothetical protein